MHFLRGRNIPQTWLSYEVLDDDYDDGDDDYDCRDQYIFSDKVIISERQEIS
jgi:hypothetical protein